MLALKRVQTRLGFDWPTPSAAPRRSRAAPGRNAGGPEVNDAITAATQGDLTVRIPLDGKNALLQRPVRRRE
jgi:hypothetical protein